MKLSEVRAVVTGANSGLGAATARLLAEHGGRVAGVARHEDRGEALERELAGACRFWSQDVTDAAGVDRTFDDIAAWFGEVPNTLVNCAGIGVIERTVSRTPTVSDAFRDVVRTNVFGTYEVVLAFTGRLARWIDEAGMKGDGQEHGLVVLTSSIAAWDGQVGQVAYATAKGALASMTLPLAREGAPYGMRCVSIAPGVFETPMIAPLPQPARDGLATAHVWPRRFGTPSEFAELVVAVVKNPMLNGEVIRLDGAMRMPAR
jgi:NAD(P)-dependent dehydrogenase (short-subunit alcohol dehydrogenase family)